MFSRAPLLLALLASASLPCLGLSTPSCPDGPDTLFLHGRILTGAHLQPDDPSPTPAHVSALAVCQGTLTAVGSDAAILNTRGPHTAIVDLHDAFVMPGFNDAHVHLFTAGQQKVLSVDLTGTRSLTDMQRRIHSFAITAPPGSWILGGGWDQTLWTDKTLPTRQQIDTVTAGHPAALYRVDQHILIANSAALASSGITSSTPDPSGGKFDRDASGALTGIVREIPATSLLERHIPPPTRAQRRAALLAAMHDALAHGVTSVQDYSPDWDNFLIFEELERQHQLPIRVAEWLDFTLPLHILEHRRELHPADDSLLHLTQLKGFMDGSLGSHTAALATPYADDPLNRGIPRYTQTQLNKLTADRARAGFQIGFHAIGDQANTIALNAIAAAEQADTDAGVSPASHRHRIEHAQVLLPGDFDRFHQLGVIASMQPSHLLTDMNWAGQRLGNSRSRYSYAWRSFLDHHVVLAFGTDYPVESINPFRGLYAAITRQNEAGSQTFHPEQRITLPEALFAYTEASAYAEFRDTSKGRLEPGFLADFILLDQDIEAATPQRLLATRVLQTFLNGKLAYTAPQGSAH